MKVEEIREMSEEDLRQALEDNRQELFNLRFQLATRKTKNHQRIPVVKRDIARIMTVLRERDLMAQYAGADFSDLERPGLSAGAGEKQARSGGGLLGRMRRGGNR